VRIGGSVDMAAMVHRIGHARTSRDRSAERLASGRRIVRAGDDPAGLAKAARLSARARGLAQTQRNLRDSRSLLEVADAGLSQIQDHIYRVRELAVLSASDTMGRAERLTLNGEAQLHLTAIEDTAYRTTAFGQRPLVKDEKVWEPPVVAVGILADRSSSMGGEMARLPAALQGLVDRLRAASTDVRVGLARVGTEANPGTPYEGEDFIDATWRVTDIGAAGLDDELDDLTPVEGQDMDGYSSLLNASGADDWVGQREVDTFSWPDTPYRHLIVVTDTRAQEADLLGNSAEVYNNQQDVADALQRTGVTVHVVGPQGDAVARSSYIDIVDTTDGSYQTMLADGNGIDDALAAIADEILDVIDFPPPPELVEAQAGPDMGQSIDLEIPVDARLKALGLDDVRIVTKAGANDALDDLDDALEIVTSHRVAADGITIVPGYRPLVGAKMNRLDHALFIQRAMEAACDASRGRIEDLDLIEGTAEHMQRQLKLRAATAVFARAQAAERATAQAMTIALGGSRLVNASA